MTLDEAADQVRTAIGELPPGFYVKAVGSSDALLVGNDALAFAILRETIDAYRHLYVARVMWPKLLERCRDVG